MEALAQGCQPLQLKNSLLQSNQFFSRETAHSLPPLQVTAYSLMSTLFMRPLFVKLLHQVLSESFPSTDGRTMASQLCPNKLCLFKVCF
jgi:hypothetical protein